MDTVNVTLWSPNDIETESYQIDIDRKDDFNNDSGSDDKYVNTNDGEDYSNDDNRSDKNDVNKNDKYNLQEDDNIPVDYK